MSKKITALTLCAVLMVFTTSCSAAPARDSLSFQAMDTFMQLDVYGADGAAQTIKGEILRLDSLFSVADEDSDVYRLNHSGTATVDEATANIAAKSLSVCADTNGALDVTVFPVVEEWGFISGDYQIPPESKINELLDVVDYTSVSVEGTEIKIPEGARLDFGAVAKGYAADKAVQVLRENGASGAILNLGGTVAVYGKKPNADGWKIGVADPDNSAAYVGYLTCRDDKIIATSGSYERYFEGEDGKIYSHIIDPKTGYPVYNGMLSVTVISDSGILSDALSTALFVMGREQAIAYVNARGDIDCIILTDDGKAYISEGIKDSFTVADGYDIEVVAY